MKKLCSASEKTSPPQAVLVVCLRYLGDTLFLRQSLRALRRAYPDARIDALVSQGTGVALDDCADVSQVIECASGAGSIFSAASHIFFASYDWVIDFTNNDRSAFLALVSRAKVRAAFDRGWYLPWWSLKRLAYNVRPENKWGVEHIVLQRLKLLECLGVPTAGLEFGLVPREAALEAVRKKMVGMPDRILHIHPVSRDMRKALPAQAVHSVIAAALEKGWGVNITAGAAPIERDHAAACFADFPQEHIRVFTDLDWHGLVAVISLAEKYWGSDTAPSHIAAALDRTVRVDFGPSVHQHWYPLCPDRQVVVHTCTCQSQRKRVCESDAPGQCLRKIDIAPILEWFSK